MHVCLSGRVLIQIQGGMHQQGIIKLLNAKEVKEATYYIDCIILMHL